MIFMVKLWLQTVINLAKNMVTTLTRFTISSTELLKKLRHFRLNYLVQLLWFLMVVCNI